MPRDGPLFIHCTQSRESLRSILASGRLLAGRSVPPGTLRSHAWVDRWSGRDAYVMLNLGFGRLVDSERMVAGFVFDQSLALREADVEVHRRPEAWEITRLALDHTLRHHRSYLVDLLGRDGDLDRYDYPGFGLGFARYLEMCLEAGRPVLSVDLSAFSYGIVDLMVEAGPGRAELRPVVERFQAANRLRGGPAALAELRDAWASGTVYTRPTSPPLDPAEQDGHQLLVREALPLDDPTFLALAVGSRSPTQVVEDLRALPGEVLTAYRNLPVLHGERVTSLGCL